MAGPTTPAPERPACCGDRCTATATHGPGAFPVACWQHAGDWPEIPAPPPSEAPPTTESAPLVKPTAGEWETSWARDRKVRFAPTDSGSINVTEATEDGRWAVLRRAPATTGSNRAVVLGGVADLATAMRAADIWAREHGDLLDWQMPPEAPAGTRGGDCDHPMSHRMYKQDGVTGVCGRCGSVLSPSAPSPAREPAAEVTVEQLVSAISTRALGGAALLNEDAARRALGAVDDNMLRRMLAAVEGGT